MSKENCNQIIQPKLTQSFFNFGDFNAVTW